MLCLNRSILQKIKQIISGIQPGITAFTIQRFTLSLHCFVPLLICYFGIFRERFVDCVIVVATGSITVPEDDLESLKNTGSQAQLVLETMRDTVHIFVNGQLTGNPKRSTLRRDV